MKARPAHILRMVKRLSEKYEDLDFSAITTIDRNALQTRFEIKDLAGIYTSKNDTVYVGLPKDLGLFPKTRLSQLARVLLHEVIHREQLRIKPNSKAHGKVFQKLCLKYGLDPRLEIENDKGQKLKVKVPYEREFFHTAAGLYPINYQDVYEREDISDATFFASRALAKRKYKSCNAEDFSNMVNDVYLHQYHQHYPAYRLCDHIVDNYHVTSDFINKIKKGETM